MPATPFFYMVRWWVDPRAEERVFAYMKGGHVAEVASQPGFMGADSVRLDDVDPLGWRAYINIYRVESRAALDAYLASPLQQKFAGELAAFAGVMRSERLRGTTVFAHPG